MTAATAGRRGADLIRAPFTLRALRELLFCLIGLMLGLAVFAVPYAVFGLAYVASAVFEADVVARPAVSAAVLITLPLALVTLLVLAASVGRRLAAIHRGLAAWLLGARIPAPATRARTGGPIQRLGASFADGPGWRGIAYSLLKLPLGVLEGYGVFCWIVGLINMTYPFWWGLFRNHPPEVRLSPVAVLTPFGAFRVETFAGAFVAFVAGAAMVLVAPWLAHGAAHLDLAAMRGLLGPGRLAQRVEQLQDSRARAIDDAASTLRRLERDLHDGAQIRLATLALNLGMASEKLGASGPPPDLGQARELVAGGHRAAKEALGELRDLVRGIHPPVLDIGLSDALTTLITTSAIPVSLTVDLPIRPAPAIETIAYFCTAELVANAVKHSRAGHVAIDLFERGATLTLRVVDDGVGGVDPEKGTGLAGLAQRLSTVDGRFDVASPSGGPTRITIEMPIRP